MNSKLIPFFLSAIVALPAVTLAQGQDVGPPTPTPAPSLIRPEEPEGGLQVGLASFFVTITPIDGMSAPYRDEVMIVNEATEWDKLLPSGVAYKRSFYPVDMPSENTPGRSVTPMAVEITGKDLKSSLANDIADRIASRLRSQLEPYKGFSLEQRKARVKELEDKGADVKERIDAVQALKQAQGTPQAVLGDRLKRLREDQQRLQMQLDGKNARRAALMRGVNEQREVAAKAREEDPIALELRKLLKMREDEAAMKKAMAARGVTSSSEAVAADVPVSEAKIRLAEREASLGKSGKGELLDRLSDELTLVSVDTTDLEIQLAGVNNELKLYDPKSLDAKGLEKLLSGNPQLRTPEADVDSPLLNDLYKQLNDLKRERFAVQAGQITVTAVSAADAKKLPR